MHIPACATKKSLFKVKIQKLFQSLLMISVRFSHRHPAIIACMRANQWHWERKENLYYVPKSKIERIIVLRLVNANVFLLDSYSFGFKLLLLLSGIVSLRCHYCYRCHYSWNAIQETQFLCHYYHYYTSWFKAIKYTKKKIKPSRKLSLKFLFLSFHHSYFFFSPYVLCRILLDVFIYWARYGGIKKWKAV